MVSFGKIASIAAIGLGVLFLGNAIARPAHAAATGAALTETGVGLGTSLGSIGSGIGSLLGNLGTGSAQLLNPLFSLKTLIYGENDVETCDLPDCGCLIHQLINSDKWYGKKTCKRFIHGEWG